MAGRPGNVGLVAKVVHHLLLQKELLDAAFDVKMVTKYLGALLRWLSTGCRCSL
jgi:hypothetical protein